MILKLPKGFMYSMNQRAVTKGMQPNRFLQGSKLVFAKNKKKPKKIQKKTYSNQRQTRARNLLCSNAVFVPVIERTIYEALHIPIKGQVRG